MVAPIRMEDANRKSMLSAGDMLGNYRIERFLGQGGFGVTYLALDTKLDLQVAIKEYLPDGVATRRSDNSIQPDSQRADSLFRWGLSRFIKEAQTLAKFNHPNIVRVMAILELNGTAYMVMEYEEGIELKHLFNRSENCDENSLKRIVGPIIDGLSEVHRHGYIHRDIKPANILVRNNGTPVLLDFGSARQSNADQTQALTAFVTVGYAPLEQYNESGDKQQGPWTDIYALAAVLYFTITGNPPIDSTLRGSAVLNDRPDPLVSLQVLQPAGFSRLFCEAIDWALSFKIAQRPQNLDQWRARLLADDHTVLMPNRTGRPANHQASESLTPISNTETLSQPVTRSAAPGSEPDIEQSFFDQRQGSVSADLEEEPWDTVRPAPQQEVQRSTSTKRLSWHLPVIACLLASVIGGALWYSQRPQSTEQNVSAGVSENARIGEEPRIPVEEVSVSPSESLMAEPTNAEQTEIDVAARRQEAQQEADALRQKELARLQVEATAKAQEERLLAERKREAELEKARQTRAKIQQQAEAKRQADQQAARIAQEAARLAALKEERAAEDARSAELKRQQEQVEAERLAQIEMQARPITEADMSMVFGKFNSLTSAIESRDMPAVRALTAESERNYSYLEYLFRTFEDIDVAMTNIRASRMEQTISGTLHIRQMQRSNGDTAFPPQEFERISVHTNRQAQWSKINW